MKRQIFYSVGLVLVLLTFVTFSVAGDKSESGWKKAGDEIGEAASAVVDASKKSWEKTRKAGSKMWNQATETTEDIADSSRSKGSQAVDKTVKVSKGFWNRVKSTSIIWYRQVKAKVHDLTAPSTEKTAKKNN